MKNLILKDEQGKEYYFKKPKMKIWRKMIKLGEIQLKSEEDYLEIAELVLAVYPEIKTVEELEEIVDADDLIPLVKEIIKIITEKIEEKASEFPNENTLIGN